MKKGILIIIVILIFYYSLPNKMLLSLETVGRAVAQWLRYNVTNRQVASSIPNGVIGIFQ
jgi:hypothetical protein